MEAEEDSKKEAKKEDLKSAKNRENKEEKIGENGEAEEVGLVVEGKANGEVEKESRGEKNIVDLLK